MKPTTSILQSLLSGRDPNDVLATYSPDRLVISASEPIWQIPVRVVTPHPNLEFELILGGWGEVQAAMGLIVSSHPIKLTAPFGDVGLLAQAWDVMESVWCQEGKGTKQYLEGTNFITFGLSPVALMFELADLQSPRNLDAWRVSGKQGHHDLYNGTVRIYATDGQRALVGYHFGRHYCVASLANITDLEPDSGSEAYEKETSPKSKKETSTSLAMDLLG